MSGIVLSPDELLDLTGFKQPAKQRAAPALQLGRDSTSLPQQRQGAAGPLTAPATSDAHGAECSEIAASMRERSARRAA